MNLNSKKTSLVLLGVTAIVCSRVLFALFDDPEGPNLLVVVGMAVLIYLLSLAAYVYGPVRQDSLKKLPVLVLGQIVLVALFYFILK